MKGVMKRVMRRGLSSLLFVTPCGSPRHSLRQPVTPCGSQEPAMLIYIHGFNSSALSFKAGLLEERMAGLGRAGDFACPELPHRPPRRSRCSRICERSLPQRPALIGSSLGGYYATWLAESRLAHRAPQPRGPPLRAPERRCRPADQPLYRRAVRLHRRASRRAPRARSAAGDAGTLSPHRSTGDEVLDYATPSTGTGEARRGPSGRRPRLRRLRPLSRPRARVLRRHYAIIVAPGDAGQEKNAPVRIGRRRCSLPTLRARRSRFCRQSCCFRFRPTPQKWSKLAPFPEAAEELYGIASGGKLYVFGGLAPGWTPKGLVYESRPGDRSWTKKKNMPLASHHVALAELNGKIYVFGGFVKPESGPTAWCRSTTCGSTIRPPTTGKRSRRCRPSAVRRSRGGRRQDLRDRRRRSHPGSKERRSSGAPAPRVGTNEVYDPATNTWETRSPMPTARNHAPSAW